MKVLAASVTNKDESYLRPHLSSLLSQDLPEHVVVDYLYIADGEQPLAVLDELEIPSALADPKDSSSQYAVSEEGHNWSKNTFYWLGAQKQKLLTYAQEHSYDAIFLVDSDLVLGSDTLSSLISTGKEIVSGVFWTKWTPSAPPLPQVWQEHPYEFQGRGVEAHEHLSALAHRKLLKVGGLGACTLIRASALPRVQYYPPLQGLPETGMWQGEDRTFCISAARNHIELWADAWPDIFHMYRPSDVPKGKAFLHSHRTKLKKKAEVGDLVNASLSPVEEPALSGYTYAFRGRLGASQLLEDVQSALMDMSPGEDKFVKVHFPIWWEVPEYQNRTKTIRVRMNGVKEFSYAPTLERNPEKLFTSFYENK